MKCPRCQTPLENPEVIRCGSCGFDSASSAQRHGDYWVRLERLTDAAHCLRLADKQAIESALDDFERRFPQVFFAVYLGVLPLNVTVSEVGFWLLNHAAFGTHDLHKRNEFGIVLVIDPASGTASFSLGYSIETLGRRFDVSAALRKIRKCLASSDYASGINKAIKEIDSRLRCCGTATLKGASNWQVVEDDLGMPKLKSASLVPALPRPPTAMPTYLALLMAIAFVCVAVSRAFADHTETELPLPQWDQPSWKAGNLGGALFPEGMGLEPVTDGFQANALQPPIASEFAAAPASQDLSLFLPEALLGKVINPHPKSRPTAPESLRECSEEFLTKCRSSDATLFVIDPDGHLPKSQKSALSRFLDYHARDARLRAYVLLIKGNEKLPDAARLADVASGALKRGDACLAVYPVGEPWRARLYVSESVGNLAGIGELNSMADDCARDAGQVRDTYEQLHRFAVRLSIRLFWLERLITPKELMVETLPTTAPTLKDQVHASFARSDRSGSRSHLDMLSVVLGVVLSLSGGASTLLFLRNRRRRNLKRVWILPEIEYPTRLGGAFCGGGGAVIQYRQPF